MATTVVYSHDFPYRYLAEQDCPGIVVTISNEVDRHQAVDIDAHLDSGAGRSLLDGQIAGAIGLELLAGRPTRFSWTAGAPVEARLHRVRLSHPLLGDFPLEVGFSLDPIRRNLLGRDFFAYIQIGFREQRLSFYIEPVP